jgi:hypothetical protein
LRAALALLGPNGENWCQGARHIGNLRCALGAIELAAGLSPGWYLQHPVDGNIANIRRFEEAVAAMGGATATWIINDDGPFSRIKTALEKAILIS